MPAFQQIYVNFTDFKKQVVLSSYKIYLMFFVASNAILAGLQKACWLAPPPSP